MTTKKKDNTYPENRYEVRYTQQCGPGGKIENINQKFTNKKKAIQCFNMLKEFVEFHKKGVIAVEEMDWGLMYFKVDKVFGVYDISYTAEKIK